MKKNLRLLLAMGLGAASAWSGATTALPLRSLAASCAACHGSFGVAQPGMASLAGQPREELLKKLLDFKTGRKPASLMPQLSKGYSDEQLEQLAAYFAALKP